MVIKMIIEYPIKIFIDNCIDSLSVTLQSVYKEQNIVWGDTTQNVNIFGFERKPLPSADQEWKIKQIVCLPTVRRLAVEEKIKLYTYNELTHEAWKRPGSFPLNFLGDLFAGITFQHVDAAVERSFFFQMEFSEYLKNDEMIKFCVWLLDSKVEELADRFEGQERYPVFLLNNLRQVERFRELCKGLAKKQYPDAFHLWSAEVNEMEYFLTTDRKFIQVMTETKNINLPCKPVSPSDFLNILRVKDLEPFEFKPNQFYNIFGKPS